MCARSMSPSRNYAVLGFAWSLLLACASSPADDAKAGPGGGPTAPAFANEVTGAASSTGAEQPAAPRAQACALAETLRPLDLTERSVMSAAGTTLGGGDTVQSRFGSCAGASSGPELWYQLDLSAAQGTISAHAVLDAGFDAVLDLRRGPCGDTQSLACDRAAALGNTSSSLIAQLEPGMYWLVIDGAGPASAGDFRLQLELNPRPGCVRPPPNRTCATALPLEPLARQTVLLDEACAADSDEDSALYYELDLSAEPGPVLTTLSIWSSAERRYEMLRLHPVAAGGLECEAALASSYLGTGAAQRSSAALQTLLAPGRYVVEADPRSLLPGTQVALGVQLDRETCGGGAVANDCAQAIDIDPNLASQVVAGSTVCNANLRTPLPCVLEGDDAPEQLHRLDLRGATGPTRTRVTTLVDGLSFEPVLYVLTSTGNGDCGDFLYCDDRLLRAEGPPFVDLLLQPALYFVGVDGSARGAAGTYRLLIELESAEPSPCVNDQIYECMRLGSYTNSCCSEWSPLCNQMVAACGLIPATQDCVCTAQPACCESSLLPVDCSATLLACNYLCPDFLPSDNRCWDVGE